MGGSQPRSEAGAGDAPESAVSAVLFDVDGVLVDSVPRKLDRLDAMLADDLGLDVSADELVGLNRRDKYDRLRDRTAIDVSEASFVRRYEDAMSGVYADEVDPLDGFEGLARDLRSGGAQVGLVSAGPGPQVRTVVDRFGLDDLVDVVATPDVIEGRSKPHPDLYEHAADALGVAPERCVAVEDSARGTTAAARAGAHCVGYAPPENPPQDLSAADEVVDSPAALRERVLELVRGDEGG